jgi:rod shape-determining protein MreD
VKAATVVLGIIVALALQTSVLPFLVSRGATIDLVLVVVVWAALQFGPAAGLLTGCAAGLAQDALSGGIIGVGGMAKTLVGFMAGVVGSQFIVANALPRFVVLLAGALINAFTFLGLYAVIERRGLDMPWRQAGTQALATAVVGIVVIQLAQAVPGMLRRRRLRRGY